MISKTTLIHARINPIEVQVVRGRSMSERKPEIILTDKAGKLLEVEALAYPEDTNLIVDPYSDLEEPEASMAEVVANAEATLPRPLGEIISAQAVGLNATWLFRLVLLDFKGQHHCRAETVEETLRQLIWQIAPLEIQSLGFDRFELLEPCITAFRVLSCLCEQVKKLETAGSFPPTTFIFSLHQEATLRRYQVALDNLP